MLAGVRWQNSMCQNLAIRHLTPCPYTRNPKMVSISPLVNKTFYLRLFTVSLLMWKAQCQLSGAVSWVGGYCRSEEDKVVGQHLSNPCTWLWIFTHGQLHLCILGRLLHTVSDLIVGRHYWAFRFHVLIILRLFRYIVAQLSCSIWHIQLKKRFRMP